MASKHIGRKIVLPALLMSAMLFSERIIRSGDLGHRESIIDPITCNCSDGKVVAVGLSSDSLHKGEIFEEFACRFFSDSVFQISRIIFPMPGKNHTRYIYERDTTDADSLWLKDEWLFFSLNEIKEHYPASRRKVLVDSAIETHYMPDACPAGYFYYIKIDNKWYLNKLTLF